MKRILYLSLALLLALTSCSEAPIKTQNLIDGKLPRTEASAQFTAAMEAFYAAIDSAGTGLHSIMVVHHGKVAAEKWWEGHSPDQTHAMYSVSKSFTATGVGFAVSEGLFSLDDKVVSFFPDKAPADPSPNLAAMSVRDLLIMATGQVKQPPRSGEDWVRDFLSAPVEDAPGTLFRYNSMATFMLSAIIQKVSGQKLFDYLQPRLFEPLEISGIEWEESPNGISTGGWGLSLKTEDMAKFGQLFLQKGIWNDEQLLPEGWVEEASSWKIVSGPSGNETLEDPDSDWTQGYCYQMWRCRHNAYRADGAYGQYIIVMPDKDAVVAITAHARNMQAEINLVWEHILPAFK